ncbi:hypothetical protein ACFQV8_17565 [Pseudonocardia benzenivorans]
MYGDSWVDHDELRAKALEVFELIWRRIAGFEVAEHLAEVSHRVGVRRAEQGVPLSEVQAAANRDFQVVWEAMLAEADDHEAAALLQHAPAIWAIVEDHTQRITEAYRRRSNELDDLSDDRRREWFRRLLKCDGERPDVVKNAAEVLELPVEGRFRVVIATREHAGRLRDARDALMALRWSFHYQEVEGGDLLVIQSTQEQDKRVMICLGGSGVPSPRRLTGWTRCRARRGSRRTSSRRSPRTGARRACSRMRGSRSRRPRLRS